MKFSVASEFISALAFSFLIFIYIRNGGVVSVTIIVLRSFLRSFTI